MTIRNDDWDDLDDDGGDEADWSDDETAAAVACPNCGREVYEDAQRCPY